MLDMVKKKYWIILPAEDILPLPGLMLSPLGVVPQAERRPRIICDYTFNGVNPDTLSRAPQDAMQFSHTLRRILWKLANANPKYGPVYMGKYDLSDGFYHIQLALRAILALAVILPTTPGEAAMAALPLTLPMGVTKDRGG